MDPSPRRGLQRRARGGLQITGKSVGVQPVGAGNGFKAIFETQFAAGEVTAIARLADGPHESWSLTTPAGLRNLRVRADRTVIDASDGDLAYVEMSLEDMEGRICTQGTEPLSVLVDGEGVLQVVGNGDPQSQDSFCANVCNTYEGRALAVLRPTGPGEITVTVKGADQTATVTVMALKPNTVFAAVAQDVV